MRILKGIAGAVMGMLLSAAPALATPVVFNLNSPTATGTGFYTLIDGTAPGQLQLTAAKNKTETAVWTATKAGTFSFDWGLSGTAAAGASGYFQINGSNTLLGSGLSSGSSNFTLALGDVFGFRLVGTTLNKTNSANLQISNFVPSAPEIDGAVLPLAVLLLGLGFFASRRVGLFLERGIA
jgi:hypothetical protein